MTSAHQLTVNSMVEFFKTAKGMDLEVLTSATLMKLEEIKEKTATGTHPALALHKHLQTHTLVYAFKEQCLGSSHSWFSKHN